MQAQPHSRSANRLHDQRHLRWCILIGLLVFAVHSVPFIRYYPGDAHQYLIPWYQHIIDEGRLRVFSRPFSNYTPPYLYLLSLASLLDGWIKPLIVIKLLSCVGAAWMAYAVWRLLSALHSRWAPEGALGSVLLPSIVLNVSFFGQADTFWIAPCTLAMAAAVERRSAAVAAWSGVAFAFKAQAVFFAPFCLYFFLTNRPPRQYWIIPPAIYLIAMMPAWMIGWPAWDLATVYLRQAQWQPELGGIFISNGASWWTIYGALFPRLALETFWFGYLTAAIAVALYVWLLSNRRLSPKQLVAAAALSSAGLPFLLPGMHERFFLLADILTYCLALAEPKRKTIAAALLMQCASCIPGYGWAIGLVRLSLAACFFSLAAMLILIEDLAEAPRRRSAEPGPHFRRPQAAERSAG